MTAAAGAFPGFEWTESVIDKTLTIVGYTAAVDGTSVWTHFSMGRVVERLARKFRHVYWCAKVVSSESSKRFSYKVPSNVTLIPMPWFDSTLDGLFKFRELRKSYDNGVRLGDYVLIRGILPWTGSIYRSCLKYRKRPLHWIVGNSYRLMREGRRDNAVRDFMALVYAWRWYRNVRKLIRKSSGAALCNGRELYEMMRGIRRYEIVSSTVTEDEFFYRDDTCQNDVVRIVTTCFIRPEKGVEYLIDAVAKVHTSKKVELCCIGSFEKGTGYREKLLENIRKNGLDGRVHFMGYRNPEEFTEFYKTCDIFVLASLSEGTPRCILESRAAGLPTIATDVGGIPSSIADREDGILVPSKDSSAIAAAVDTIVEDGELRRKLIKNGYETARKWNLENFVDRTVRCLEEINER